MTIRPQMAETFGTDTADLDGFVNSVENDQMQE